MVISRKPPKTKNLSINQVESLIQKGGSIAFCSEKVSEKPVSLRIPSDMLEKIDFLIQNRPIKIPRHTWLLEALFEKIERETSD
jgi:hypothetical protein